MRKIKRPKLGEYVLVSKFTDKDPYDPWYVGFVCEIIENTDGVWVKVKGCVRVWGNVFRITAEEGEMWIKKWGDVT